VRGNVAGVRSAWSGGWCRVGGRVRQVSQTCGSGVMVDLPVGLAGPVDLETEPSLSRHIPEVPRPEYGVNQVHGSTC
jgi:hypothetical protein